MHLRLGKYRLELSQPRVMGVLNRTPDSFSDGGTYLALDAALAHARAMREAGADIIDVGGESTRPGAAAVSTQEEVNRVLPVIERLTAELDVPVSVDTSKPEVMRAAIAAGAAMVNDVYGLRRPGSLEAVAGTGAAVCIMHMQGEPRTMQADPRYEDVVAEVGDFLQHRAQACREAGVDADRIVLDPGFGFGKTLEHNILLLQQLSGYRRYGYPLLVGLSRKSMIGKLLGGAAPEARLSGSLAAAVAAVLNGARIVRCHDVRETVDALRVAAAVLDPPPDSS